MGLHNGTNVPESTTMRMFRPVRQVAAPGTKSAVSSKFAYIDADSLLVIIIIIIIITTSVLSNLAKGRIALVHESFSRFV